MIKALFDSGCSMEHDWKHSPSFRFPKTLNGGYVTLEEEHMEAKIIGKFLRESYTEPLELFSNACRHASYFGDAAPRTVADAQIEEIYGFQDENDATEKSHDDRQFLRIMVTADHTVNMPDRT
ncbi:hypothetical protein Tco_0561740 [Tanacetum coccineum]